MAHNHNDGVICMELLLAFKSMTAMEYALAISLVLHVLTFRLTYKYNQLDKIVLLIADRSHRDIIDIDHKGDYKIKPPLNKPRVEQ